MEGDIHDDQAASDVRDDQAASEVHQSGSEVHDDLGASDVRDDQAASEVHQSGSEVHDNLAARRAKSYRERAVHCTVQQTTDEVCTYCRSGGSLSSYCTHGWRE